ncbi:hypothetical protein [Paenibacillus tyrfis]|uniref:hypothetical protein n=1 Tax=Paenibacillus tyrfis TaxID=1501230 RepID=UPI000B58E457|nr:hypothetical protein [Paenibacillus tyrfis]
MKKIVSAVVSAALVCSFAGSALAATPNNAPVAIPLPTDVKITPMDIPGPEGSWTTVHDQNRIFDNTYEYLAIGAAVKIAMDYVFKGAKITGTWTSGSTTLIAGVVTKAVADLSQNQYVYSKLRLGISWNSYYGYYEYVNAVTFYTDGSFSRPKTTHYAPTGTRVDNEVLKSFGLYTGN